MTDFTISDSNSMRLNDVLAHLAESDTVEGIALFGSLPTQATNEVSDYDILIVVTNPPVKIFQLQTYIDGRMADVTFVESDVIDRILTLDKPVHPTSDEGFAIGWLEQAQINYDLDGRLASVQRKLENGIWRQPASASDLYSDWFWLNFDLLQMKRMALSADPIYQLTVDIHLMTNLSQLWRAYCRYRDIHWRGVKAAARHLQKHDPNYLALYQECIREPDRAARLERYAQLVTLTLAPRKQLPPPGTTTVCLKNPLEQPERVNDALIFWERLVAGK